MGLHRAEGHPGHVCRKGSIPWQAHVPLVMPRYGHGLCLPSHSQATPGINSPHSQLSRQGG